MLISPQHASSSDVPCLFSVFSAPLLFRLGLGSGQMSQPKPEKKHLCFFRFPSLSPLVCRHLEKGRGRSNGKFLRWCPSRHFLKSCKDLVTKRRLRRSFRESAHWSKYGICGCTSHDTGLRNRTGEWIHNREALLCARGVADNLQWLPLKKLYAHSIEHCGQAFESQGLYYVMDGLSSEKIIADNCMRVSFYLAVSRAEEQDMARIMKSFCSVAKQPK